ncbi:MAG: rane protein [Streptomyces oryziradicis]|nr:rane protein [Actinacidiphila oryziradicis]
MRMNGGGQWPFNKRIMPFLHSLVAVSRMMRHTPHIGADLPPDDTVRLDAPDERLAAASTGLQDGDFKPVSELLARTRETAWWEARDRYVGWLAEQHLIAAGRSGPRDAPGRSWLDTWWDADPDDPDLALLHAEIAVRGAWRTGRGHVARLHDAGPQVRTAAEAAPGDPVPWRIALTRARGLRAPREEFDALWAQAVARSPHHYGCHVSALRFLREDPASPPEEYLAFAEDAAERVLPGSLVNALPLIASYEYLLSGGRGADSYIDDAVDRALQLSAWHERGDREPAEVRNVLTQVLILRKRWPEALDQFRAIGIHATSFPWSRTGEPLHEFLEMRTGVRVQLASTVRLTARAGGPYA